MAEENSQPKVTETTHEFNLNDAVETYQEAEFKVEQVKNTAKRKMAWISLAAICIVMIGCFAVYFVNSIDIARFTAVKGTLETGMWVCTSIIGFYFGFAAFSNSKWSQPGDQQAH